MPYVSFDRVKETTTTTGTGTVTLAGAATGCQAFSVVTAEDVVAYAIIGPTEWEAGFGTWHAGGTLSRDRVLASSNGGALVNFSAGSKDVFNSFPAQCGISPLVGRVQTGDTFVPCSSVVYIPDDYEIASGHECELDVNAVLEIG